MSLLSLMGAGLRGLGRLAVPGMAGYGTYSAIRDLKKRRADKLRSAKLLEAKKLEEARLAQMNPRQRWAAGQDYMPQTQNPNMWKRGGSVHSRGRKVPGMYHGK